MIGRTLAALSLVALTTSAQTPALPKNAGANGTFAAHHQKTNVSESSAPVPFSLANSKESEQETARYHWEQQRQTSPDWWTRAGIICAALIGIMQTVVFGYQAIKLRQTVRDGEEAIKAAVKAANAATRQAIVAETALRTFEMPEVVLDAKNISIKPSMLPGARIGIRPRTTAQITFSLRNVGRSAAVHLSTESVLSIPNGEARWTHHAGSLAPNETTKNLAVNKASEWRDDWFPDIIQNNKFLRLSVQYKYRDGLNQTIAISQTYRFDNKMKRFVVDGLGTKSVSNEYNPSE